ncbi:hypothetical protein L1887_21090 [Cichorium endivia]|nr:hypothetical protein L1887_21090 [Cichorium endivia]
MTINKKRGQVTQIKHNITTLIAITYISLGATLIEGMRFSFVVESPVNQKEKEKHPVSVGYTKRKQTVRSIK